MGITHIWQRLSPIAKCIQRQRHQDLPVPWADEQSLRARLVSNVFTCSWSSSASSTPWFSRCWVVVSSNPSSIIPDHPKHTYTHIHIYIYIYMYVCIYIYICNTCEGHQPNCNDFWGYFHPIQETSLAPANTSWMVDIKLNTDSKDLNNLNCCNNCGP